MSRGYASIGLCNVKNPYNVGGALRAMYVYDGKLCIMSGNRIKAMIKHPADTTRAHMHIPTMVVDDIIEAVPYNCVPVAIEISDEAVSLVSYIHPERAFYIFGPEDGSIPKSVSSQCRDVVMIPTRRCMNLAATVNVVLYDRMVKRGEA